MVLLSLSWLSSRESTRAHLTYHCNTQVHILYIVYYKCFLPFVNSPLTTNISFIFASLSKHPYVLAHNPSNPEVTAETVCEFAWAIDVSYKNTFDLTTVKSNGTSSLPFSPLVRSSDNCKSFMFPLFFCCNVIAPWVSWSSLTSVSENTFCVSLRYSSVSSFRFFLDLFRTILPVDDINTSSHVNEDFVRFWDTRWERRSGWTLFWSEFGFFTMIRVNCLA